MGCSQSLDQVLEVPDIKQHYVDIYKFAYYYDTIDVSSLNAEQKVALEKLMLAIPHKQNYWMGELYGWVRHIDERWADSKLPIYAHVNYARIGKLNSGCQLSLTQEQWILFEYVFVGHNMQTQHTAIVKN